MESLYIWSSKRKFSIYINSNLLTTNINSNTAVGKVNSDRSDNQKQECRSETKHQSTEIQFKAEVNSKDSKDRALSPVTNTATPVLSQSVSTRQNIRIAAFSPATKKGPKGAGQNRTSKIYKWNFYFDFNLTSTFPYVWRI